MNGLSGHQLWPMPPLVFFRRSPLKILHQPQVGGLPAGRDVLLADPVPCGKPAFQKGIDGGRPTAGAPRGTSPISPALIRCFGTVPGRFEVVGLGSLRVILQDLPQRANLARAGEGVGRRFGPGAGFPGLSVLSVR